MSSDQAKVALALAARGYFVLPAYGHRKGAGVIGKRGWGEFIDEGPDGKDLLDSYLHQSIHSGEATGFALCPRPTDPIPLLILDIDSYDSGADVWPGPDPKPPGLGEVRSASGGTHFYFRLPAGVDPAALPYDFDFGNGIKGETRVSRASKALIMLPGSRCLGKLGGVGEYTGSIDLDTLPEPPEGLLARLCARPKQEPRGEGGVPTEIAHLLELLPDDVIPEGEQNNTIAKVGQMIGRMYPVDALPRKVRDLLWEKFQPRITADWTEAQFNKALYSGHKTGRENAGKYNRRDTHPTVSDVLSECDSLFGGTPWMKEIKDAQGKRTSYLIGIGGSAKRPDEAAYEVEVDKPADALFALTRITGADEDAVVRSPLHIQTGWGKVLSFHLNTGCEVEYLGATPEAICEETLGEWAKNAAADQRFLEQRTGPWQRWNGQPFVVWQPGKPLRDVHLMVTPDSLESLMIRSKDIPAAKRYIKQRGLQVGLRGARGKAVAFSIGEMPEGVQVTVTTEFEKFIQKGMRDAED